MQGRLQVPTNIKNVQMLDIVETLSVLSCIGGAIASVVSQQVVFASIPLSLSVTLNLVNRRRLLDSINQSNQTAVAQLIQEKVETQTKLGKLTEQLAEVQQLSTDLGQSTSNLQDYQSNQTAVAQLIQENVETQAKLGTLTDQLAEVHQLTTDLHQENSSIHQYYHILCKEQTKIANTVSCLRKIETCTQAIRINPNYAQSYYNRGSIYQNLGYKEAAAWDHTEAIRINPSYAEAYHDRGLARAHIGDKKGAVEDLREAGKLFFEKGDIANYQTAKDLSNKLHELGSQPRNDASEKIALECLFS